MPEQRARLVDAPFADQAPDARAADDEVLVADRIDLLRLEAVARAEDAQHREVARAIVAEQEVRADPDFGDAQPVDEHGAHERFGLPVRQLGREAHDRGALHAGVGDRLELLRLGHQQRRRLVGPDHARRMRVEGHDDGGRAALFGDAPHAIENLAVSAVQAVEVAEREHRVDPPRRTGVFREVNDVHGSRANARSARRTRRKSG